MESLISSVSDLSNIGARVSTLLWIVGLAGFVYIAFRAYQIRSIDE